MEMLPVGHADTTRALRSAMRGRAVRVRVADVPTTVRVNARELGLTYQRLCVRDAGGDSAYGVHWAYGPSEELLVYFRPYRPGPRVTRVK